MNQTVEHELKWHTSYWPFLLSFGILFLAPLSFIFYFVYNKPMLSILSLGVGAPLVLISIAGWVKEGLEDEHGYSQGHSIWAMPILIVSEGFLFIGLFAAYWGLRLSSQAWPPAGTPEKAYAMPIILTAILALSAFSSHRAEKSLDNPEHAGFVAWLVVTLIFAVGFMGLTAYEWSRLIGEGFTIKTNVYSSAFYTITGFHASHVLVGVGIFISILIPALSGKISYPFVKSACIYWHFVELVWLFVVSQVYFW